MDIVNILKDKLKGTKLYSSICGECLLSDVNEETKSMFAYIQIIINNKRTFIFNKEGKLDSNGECLLFPSNKMRDWSKFAWKKGDVLIDNVGKDKLYFNRWADNTYTHFYANSNNLVTRNNICNTSDYTLASEEDTKNFIAETKKKFSNYKVNLKTLDVEEKKEHEFKPFDKVLCRDNVNERWIADIFSWYQSGSDYPYYCMRRHYKQCIPYEGNEHFYNTRNILE